MQCSSLLLRLAQRCPLPVLPLLAAYAPECFRGASSLHVFARRPGGNHSKVSVCEGADGGDLKRAVIAELRLEAAPDCVHLLREVGNGSSSSSSAQPVPLDSSRQLSEQGVLQGCSVLVEVLPAAAMPAGHSQSAAQGRARQALTMDASPAAVPGVEYEGLRRSSELTLFSRAVCAAQVGPVCAASGTRIWRLSHPAAPSAPLAWPLLGAQALVERDFYARVLAEGQWLGGLSGAQRRLTVLGQPGCGKSAFGLWLLAQLLRSSRTVVYSRSSSAVGRATPLSVTHAVFHAGAAFELCHAGVAAVAPLLAQPSVVHICDGLAPRLGDACHKVLIASSEPDAWRWFVQKEHSSTAHFPCYDLAELEALRGAEGAGAALTPEAMALRVRAWGPSTRAVFSPRQRELGEGLLQALSARSLEELQRAIGGARAGDAASGTPHSLFLLHADRETLRSTGVTLRSQAVALRVARQVAVGSCSSTILPLLQRPPLAGTSPTLSIAGAAFEAAAIEVLGQGGGKGLPACPLVAARSTCSSAAASPAAAPWQLLPAPTAVHCFATLAELAQQCSVGAWSLRQHCFRPLLPPSLPAIGLIGPGLCLFQATVNPASHELKVTTGGRSEGKGLAALYLTLLPLLPERWEAQQPHLDVCFVVPEGCARTWKPQALVLHKPRPGHPLGAAAATAAPKQVVSIVQCKGGGTGFSIDGRVVEVRQHVMEMPEAVLDAWLKAPAQPRDAIDEASES